MTAVERFAISFVGSKYDNRPRRSLATWEDLVGHLTKARITDCTHATCGTGIHAELDRDGKPIGCRHKNGPGWIPATFSTGRKKTTVEQVSLLVVDGDHLPDDDALQAVLARLDRHRYVAHPTHSDRPGDRCARIAIPLSCPVPGADWPRFWSAAMAALGMPADPSCCDAGRLYYLPARPSDAEFWFAVHDGEALDVATIIASAPQAVPTVAASLEVDEQGSVGEGQRHAMLKSLAGSMRRRGAGLVEIEAALLLANLHRCKPPKSESVVKEIAAWAAAQPVTSLPPQPPRANREPPPRPARERDDEPAPEAPEAPDDDVPPPSDEHAPSVDETEARDFVYGSKGIIESQANVMLALRKLGVSVSADEFARHELIHGLPGFGPRLDDAALRELRLLIDERYTFRLQKEFFVDVVTRYAWRNRFHPVRDYLDGLTWDRTPRLDRWLIDYAGAPDTTYVRAVSRLILVAAVRRIRLPGCKFDEMVILESEQGTNKSTALKIVAVRDEWFADDLPLDGDTKRLMEQTGGKWIVEAGELKGMSKSDVAQLKSCLSRQVDEARLSYDRKPTIAPRQFVIIGTTNETEGYLRDTTGNRRFWPVLIQAFKLAELAAVRDQLWAEAAAAEAAGESIRLDPALYGAAQGEQAAREIDDPIEIALRDALGDSRGTIKTLDVWEILDIAPGKATQDQNARVGAAMRRLGWESTRRRFGGARQYAYERGADHERGEQITVNVDGYGPARRVHISGGAR